MIDSHCHLDREPLISNLSQVLIRAKDVGLEKILTICTTSSGYNDILDIVKNTKMNIVMNVFDKKHFTKQAFRRGIHNYPTSGKKFSFK